MEQQIKEFDSLTELLEDLEREGITGYWRQQIMRRFLAQRAIVKKIPYVGSFELTPLCNLDCKMCYVHLNKSQMDRELLTTKQWIDIFQQAIDAGMMNAEITGGECLTYPGFKEIYLYLLSRGIGVSLLTNGILLTDDMVKFLSIYRPETVQVTLYGSCEDAYERVTGHRAFGKTIEGIERLRQAGIKVKVSVTPNRYGEDDIMRTVELLRSMGVNYGVSNSTLHARPETGRLIDDYAIREDVYVEVQKDEMDYRRKLQREISSPMKPTIQYRTKGLKAEGMPCGAGKNSFHVNWKGEMCPCISFSALTFSIEEFGFSTAWQKLNHRVTEYSEPDECRVCENRNICAMCPAERTGGVLGGALNKFACRRIQSLIQVGFFQKDEVKPQEECGEI